MILCLKGSRMSRIWGGIAGGSVRRTSEHISRGHSRIPSSRGKKIGVPETSTRLWKHTVGLTKEERNGGGESHDFLKRRGSRKADWFLEWRTGPFAGRTSEEGVAPR